MDVDFMKKMKAKLTAVSVANKERNETPMVERETPNSPNIDNPHESKNVTHKSMNKPRRKRRNSVTDINIKIGDDPELLAEQYIRELGILDENKRAQVYKRVTKHLCDLQYREILAFDIQKREIENKHKMEMERITYECNESKRNAERELQEKIKDMKNNLSATNSETVELYEKKVNDVLAYSKNIEDILSKSRTENKSLEKKLKLAVKQLLLVKPVFDLLETEEISEEHIALDTKIKRDMKSRLENLMEKNNKLQNIINEKDRVHERELDAIKMQNGKFLKEFRESYDLQLSKYKEEIARVAKNEIELRQQFSSQVLEVTKRLEDDNRQKIQHMHEEHEQKIESINQKNEDSLNTIKAQHNEIVAALTKKYESSSETTRVEIRELKQQHSLAINKITKDNIIKTNALNEEIRDSKQNCETLKENLLLAQKAIENERSKLVQLKQKFADLQSSHTLEIDELVKTQKTILSKEQTRLNDVVSVREKKIEELENAIDGLKLTFKAKETSLLSNLESSNLSRQQIEDELNLSKLATSRLETKVITLEKENKEDIALINRTHMQNKQHLEEQLSKLEDKIAGEYKKKQQVEQRCSDQVAAYENNIKDLNIEVANLQKKLRAKDQSYSEKLAEELKFLQNEQEKQMALKDEIFQKRLGDQEKSFEKFIEQLRASSKLERDRLKEHLESIQAIHKITLSDLKAEQDNELRAREVKKENMEKKCKSLLSDMEEKYIKEIEAKDASYNAERKLHNSKLKKLREENKSLLSDMEEKYIKEIEAKDASYNAEQKLHDSKLKKLREENKVSMKNFKLERETAQKTHEDEIRLLREKNEKLQLQVAESVNEVQEKMKAQHIQDMNTLRETLNLEKRTAIDVYSQKLDEELQKHNTLMDLERKKMEEKWTVKLENSKSTSLAEYESNRQSLINEYEQTIKEAKEEYARSLQDKECALKTHRVEKQKLFSEINKLKQKLVKIEEDNYVKIKKELDKLQFDHNLEIQKLQTANDNILKEKLANLTNENALEKSQFEERIQDIKASFQRTIDSTQSSSQAAIAELQKEIKIQKELEKKNLEKLKQKSEQDQFKIKLLQEEKHLLEEQAKSQEAEHMKKMADAISKLEKAHSTSIHELQKGYKTELMDEKKAIHLNFLSEIFNSKLHNLLAEGFLRWYKHTNLSQNRIKGYMDGAKFVVRAVLRYVRQRKKGYFDKWVRLTEKLRSESVVKVARGKQVMKTWFLYIEAQWQRRVSESFYRWYKFGALEKKKDKTYKDVANFIIREILRNLRSMQQRAIEKWKTYVNQSKHVENLDLLKSSLSKAKSDGEKDLVQEMLLTVFVSNLKKHWVCVAHSAFRIWESATKQADTAEILGFVENDYKRKISELNEKFEVESSIQKQQVNLQKQMRQEEHEVYTLKACVHRFRLLYINKLKRGFYTWKKKFMGAKQQHSAAVMLFNTMQNNLSRKTQQKFTLWLKITLLKRGNENRKKILESFRKVEDYWEHRVQMIEGRGDTRLEGKLKKIDEFKQQLLQRVEQQESRFNLSKDKFVKEVKLIFNKAVKSIHEKTTVASRTRAASLAENIRNPHAESHINLPLPKPEKSPLTRFRNQTKNLTRRHSFSNFDHNYGQSQPAMKTDITHTQMHQSQHMQQLHLEQAMLANQTMASQPVQSMNTLQTGASPVANNSTIFSQHAPQRVKNRRKSGTAGLRALMGVTAKPKTKQ